MAISKRNGQRGFVADINVTPLVDVMLVLLIIFMVTAPMMTQGVDVDLPETTAKALRQEEKQILVTISQKGEIYLNDILLSQALLRQQLAEMAQTKNTTPVFLKADKNVPYGTVVAVMADIKDAGFDKLGMVTQPADKRP